MVVTCDQVEQPDPELGHARCSLQVNLLSPRTRRRLTLLQPGTVHSIHGLSRPASEHFTQYFSFLMTLPVPHAQQM